MDRYRWNINDSETILKAPDRWDEVSHLILDIHNVYIYYLVRHGKEIFSRILKANPEGYKSVIHDPISLSSSNQWAELLIQCQEKYPSFEQFEIKLPHTNGKAIKGVGIKKEVFNFYRDLSQLGIIGKVYGFMFSVLAFHESYETIVNRLLSLKSIFLLCCEMGRARLMSRFPFLGIFCCINVNRLWTLVSNASAG